MSYKNIADRINRIEAFGEKSENSHGRAGDAVCCYYSFTGVKSRVTS